jgi:hypothetical protein
VSTIAVNARPSCTRRLALRGDPSTPAIDQTVSSTVLVNPPSVTERATSPLAPT